MKIFILKVSEAESHYPQNSGYAAIEYARDRRIYNIKVGGLGIKRENVRTEWKEVY